jgi:hypothetical protein
MSEFDKGPAYGNFSLEMGHAAARPQIHLKGDMGPVFVRPPQESTAMTGGRVSGTSEAPGPNWDECFRAPMATPTRGTHSH